MSKGVNLVAVSFDGDEKFLRAQKAMTNFGNENDFHGLKIYGDLNSTIAMMQDSLHLLNKEKMRICDNAVDIKFSKGIASVNLLQIMVKDNTLAKDTHGLKKSDVQNADKTRDKMNCDATARICSEKAIAEVSKIPGSEPTAQFLLLMKKTKECFVDEGISLEQRLENLAYVVTFTRKWRQQIADDGQKVEAFISSNAWNCLELNATVFIRLLVGGYGDLITICSSQPSEEYFRELRAMSTYGVTCVGLYFKIYKGGNLFAKLKGLKIKNP